MRVRIAVWLLLVATHLAAGVWASIADADRVAALVAGSIYLPLWPLARAGVPVLASGGSVVALLPIVGPVLVLWIAHFPPKASEVLQDRRPGGGIGGDYYLRWSHVLSESNALGRLRLWQTEVERPSDDES